MLNFVLLIYKFFHTPTVDLHPRTRQLIERMFPTLDWSSVVFHDRLPWFLRFARINAIVIPSFYSNHVHVYLNQYIRSKHIEWNRIIVHESMHLFQYSYFHTVKNWNMGFYHPFVRRYLAYWLQQSWQTLIHLRDRSQSGKHKAYLKNPLERQAFQQEQDFILVEQHYKAHEIPLFLTYFPYLVRKNYYIDPPNSLSSAFAWLICLIVQLIMYGFEFLLTFLLKPIVLILKWTNWLPPNHIPYS